MQEQIFTFYIESKNESNIKFKTFTTVKPAKVILNQYAPSNLSTNRRDNLDSLVSYLLKAAQITY